MSKQFRLDHCEGESPSISERTIDREDSLLFYSPVSPTQEGLGLAHGKGGIGTKTHVSRGRLLACLVSSALACHVIVPRCVTGRCALFPLQVTGCSSGLGAALARELHAQTQPDGSPKYRVYATARRVKALEALESEGIHSLALDVSSESSVQEAVASVLEAEGRIDLLVNNAGLACFGPLAEQSLQEVQTMLDTNVVGVLRMIQVCKMRGEAGRGWDVETEGGFGCLSVIHTACLSLPSRCM